MEKYKLIEEKFIKEVNSNANASAAGNYQS